ncbi:Myb/SANT-like domain, harbinger transposase-derived nuclease domain protein [Tanacetum coccineum]
MEGPKKCPLVALLASMEGPKPLLAPMEGPKQRKFWSDEMIKVLLDKCIKEMNSTGLIMDYNQQLALIIVMFNYLRYVRSRKGKRKRENNSAMPGRQFTLELLQGNDRQCVELLRMPRDSFISHNQRCRCTLIHARVPINKQHLYRGRGKGDCYQNVLAICDFNMMFTFLVAGWEGVAHDSRILSEAIRNQNAPFPLPPPGDFRRRRPLNGKEKFNHSHAKLRNVIERAYGVLKARFPILKRMTPFSLTTQRNITIACFALHNFIRKEGLDDELFSTYDQLNVQLDNENVLVEDDGGVEEDQVVQPQGNASDREYIKVKDEEKKLEKVKLDT